MEEHTKNPIKLDEQDRPAAGGGTATATPEAPATPAAPTAASADAPDAAAASAGPPADAEDSSPQGGGSADLEARIVAALKTVYDPEIPVDVYELGLIYDIAVGEVDDAGEYPVAVKMTLTSPACPVAGSLPGEVEQKVASVAGVERAEVELVWDPTWNPSMMSEAARLELGFF